MEGFGNLKEGNFMEILGIFNLDLFSTFYEIVCKKSSEPNLYCTIPMH